jgi:importin-5
VETLFQDVLLVLHFIKGIHADLATKVQRKHHHDMMSALMHLMSSSEEPRVQSHAASAIVNFCEGLGDDDSGNIVGLYLQPLTERLLVLLQSGNQLAVEAALTATSSIADGVGVRLSTELA